jgi:hypothetical protein
MSARTRLRRTLGASAVLAVVAAGGSAATADAQDCPTPPPSSQTSLSFGYTGLTQQAAVPSYVSRMSVTVRGGHGGSSAGKTGAGGRPGLVTGVLPVTPGSCLAVTVGHYAGGFGFGNGGDQGGYSFSLGSFGNRGGAGSAITSITGTPLVVAGGGGGAGGNSDRFDSQSGSPGGDGGDGAGGAGPGTPQGSVGGMPARHNPPGNWDGPTNGQRRPFGGRDGQDAIQSGFAGSTCGGFSGGGGGGGGGMTGGGAGLLSYYTIGGGECDTEFDYGGGGGAGGDSYAAPSVTGTQFAVDPGDCPPNSTTAPACQGAVTLDWKIDVASVTPASGAGQGAYIDARFPTLLQAQVKAANGAPIPGFAVTFTLPTSGPSGTFDTGAHPASTVTAITDVTGTATAPVVVAGDTTGSYTATATVRGTALTARFPLTNLPVPTATSLSTLPGNPSVTQEPVRFVADVGQAPSNAPTPVGDVVFRMGGTQFARVPLDANGVAVTDPVALGFGDQGVTAQFVPASRFVGSQAALTQHVVRASTAVDIVASANPSHNGDAVTFDASVAPLAPGAGTPTGTVSFTVDGTPLGSDVPLSGGHAQSAAIPLPDGAHDVIATYHGDAGYLPSTGSSTQTVGAGATATTLSATPRNPVVGQSSVITATVTAPGSSGPPVGGVDISLDGDQKCGNVSLVAGQATCPMPADLQPGEHAITARYTPGTGAFTASTGRLTQLVSKGSTVVTVQATPDPSTFGQQVTLHAQVVAAAPAGGVPSGTAVFTVDGAQVGDPVPLRTQDGAGEADSIPIPRLAAGPHVLRVQYGGDASFVPNARGATQAVDPGETLATLTSSAPSSALGVAVRYTMRLGTVAPASGALTGLVQFSVDGNDLGLPVPASGAVAVSPAISTLTAGAHLVHAAYFGDPGFSRVDGLLTQRVVAPVRPPIVPPADRSPLLCSGSLAITAISLSGGRVRVRGVAATSLVGSTVSVVTAGHVLARPKVAADGAFSANVPRPYGIQKANLAFVATAGSARSASVTVTQHLRITRVHDVGHGRVRVEALLSGAHRGSLSARVRERVACGSLRTAARTHVRAASHRGGNRRIVVTIARPVGGKGTAAVYVEVGKQRSLPVLVGP